MNEKRLPGGLWPVMLTPLKDNNQLDLDGLKKLTDYYLDAGANGMFANCLSSEMFQLTEEERLTITQTVVNHCKGKVPVVATGSFTSDVNISTEFIKKIYDTGVNAVVLTSSIVVAPNESDAIFMQRLESILEKTGDIPFGVYECPVPYKRLISTDIMKWMADTGRFLYHKDTSCNSDQIRAKIEAVKGSNFNIMNADTPTALDTLSDGGQGISPISGNFYSELYSYMIRTFNEQGRTAELEELSAHLSVMDAFTDKFYPLSAKLFLQKRGLDITATTRIPIPSLAYRDWHNFDSLLMVVKSLAKKHNINLAL